MHSSNDDPTGRHPGKTEAAIPKALIERVDLMGQSYRERHRGQRPPAARKGRTYGRNAPVWGKIEESPLTAGSFHIWESPRVTQSAAWYKSSRSSSFSASGISRPLLREASCPRTVCKLLQNAESTCSALPAHSDDRDHLFRSIATTHYARSRPAWTGMRAPSGSSADFSVLGWRQA